MSGAKQSLSQTLAGLQELPPGAVMTEARRLARKAVKAQYQARALKFYTTPSSEIRQAVRVYLDAHREELVSQARENLRKWSGRFCKKTNTS